jgi:peptidoglycan hydrolase-like protein with peptidoglycan-binding domain/3D (Asp-Asp-Asp) domain-containing protein
LFFCYNVLMPTQTLKHSILVAVLLSMTIPMSLAKGEPVDTAALMNAGKPFTQDFVLTAYYSPLPNQCCYIKGSYEADMLLNGRGTHGADGTPVYPGMVAAPKSYPFGTRVVLPGIGTVTVHDRGGAITEWEDAHRLDIWMGSGEEGLARAIEFGVPHVTGTVYPVTSAQPAESFSVEKFPAPFERIRPFLSPQATLAALAPAFGVKGESVVLLQQKLNQAGYFKEAATGFFGARTRTALEKFYSDFGVKDAADTVTELGGALLEAHIHRLTANIPLASTLDRSSDPKDIAQAKRTLRFLGYYDGRTDGMYSKELREAIIAFQKDHALIGNHESPGAGRVGPKTYAIIVSEWREAMAKREAEHILALRRVETIVAERNLTVNAFISKGDKGDSVKNLQSLLRDMKFLKADQVTGLFGDNTEKALIQYQLQVGIIKSEKDTGAGRVGPATLQKLQRDAANKLLKVVKAEGWDAI